MPDASTRLALECLLDQNPQVLTMNSDQVLRIECSPALNPFI